MIAVVEKRISALELRMRRLAALASQEHPGERYNLLAARIQGMANERLVLLRLLNRAAMIPPGGFYRENCGHRWHEEVTP